MSALYTKEGKKTVVGKANDLEKIKTAAKKGEWKEMVIIAKGNQIVQKLNGEITCELTDETESKRAMAGLLGFQIHAGAPMKVLFKDVRLKELK